MYAAGRASGGHTGCTRAVALLAGAAHLDVAKFLREIADLSRAYVYVPTEPVPQRAPSRQGSRERPASAQLTLFDAAPPPDTPLQVPLREACGTAEAAASLVQRTCAAQGLPVVVDDPAVLERLASLLLRTPP